MRARIRQAPTKDGKTWDVEVKKWYQFHWTVVAVCAGVDAKEEALKIAEKCIYPQTIEVKQTHYC